jgi:hypothetical protein
MRLRIARLGLIGIVLLSCVRLQAQSTLYWAGGASNGVQGSAANGSGVATYASALATAPWGISYSSTGVFITGQNGTVWRMNPDGSDFKSVLSMNAGRGVVQTGGYVFIANSVANSRIFRGEYNGTSIINFNPIVSLTGAAFQGLTTDGQYLYFSDTTNDSIRRSNLDGSNVVQLVTGLQTPYDLQVAGGFLYWVDQGANLLQRSALDGSNVTTLINASFLNAPSGIYVSSDTIYFTQANLGVYRADLDGSNISQLVSGGTGYLFLDGPVSAIPEPSTYAGLAGLAAFALVILRRRVGGNRRPPLAESNS